MVNKKKFLLLPKKIDGKWYWLRYAYCKEIQTIINLDGKNVVLINKGWWIKDGSKTNDK